MCRQVMLGVSYFSLASTRQPNVGDGIIGYKIGSMFQQEECAAGGNTTSRSKKTHPPPP